MTDAPANDRTPAPDQDDELIEELTELLLARGAPAPEGSRGGGTAAHACDICTDCILCTYAW